jgi:hypothetical protein
VTNFTIQQAYEVLAEWGKQESFFYSFYRFCEHVVEPAP